MTGRVPQTPLGRIRIAAGIRAAREAAHRLGITPEYLRNIARGFSVPSAALVSRIAALYARDAAEIRGAILDAQAALNAKRNP